MKDWFCIALLHEEMHLVGMQTLRAARSQRLCAKSGTVWRLRSEVAESDFTTLLAESEASEKEAQSSYDKLTEQNTVTKTANTQEVKGKEASVKSEETALLNYKEDFATTGKELDAVLAYLDKLKPQCETKALKTSS